MPGITKEIARLAGHKLDSLERAIGATATEALQPKVDCGAQVDDLCNITRSED